MPSGSQEPGRPTHLGPDPALRWVSPTWSLTCISTKVQAPLALLQPQQLGRVQGRSLQGCLHTAACLGHNMVMSHGPSPMHSSKLLVLESGERGTAWVLQQVNKDLVPTPAPGTVLATLFLGPGTSPTCRDSLLPNTALSGPTCPQDPPYAPESWGEPLTYKEVIAGPTMPPAWQPHRALLSAPPTKGQMTMLASPSLISPGARTQPRPASRT